MAPLLSSCRKGLFVGAVLSGLTVFTPTISLAADLPLSYNVELLKIKKVGDGAVLNFKLYNDPSCTDPPVQSKLVLIEDVALIQELRLLKRIGAAAPPKTAQLRYVLADVDAKPELFLTVTGANVVPIGGACQQQVIPAAGTSVAAGTIIMWSGTLAAIPAGWALCDGANGAPDLRDQFVRGSSTGQDPGEIGGAMTHSHTVNSHTHDFSDTDASAPSDGPVVAAFAGAAVASFHDHNHEVSGTTGATAPGTSVSSHIPPFFRLAFLMKLP